MHKETRYIKKKVKRRQVNGNPLKVLAAILIVLIIGMAVNQTVVAEETGYYGSDSQDNTNLKSLEDQIKELNERIQQMEEENAIRRQLETTEEEEYDTEDEVLSAAGREYTMLKKGLIGVEYSFSYSGRAYNVLIQDPTTVEYGSDHTLNHSFNIEYPLLDNLTASVNLPLMYKIDTQSNQSAKYVTDLGDINMSFSFQPYKSGGELPTLITSLGFNFPTGRSPYDIDPDQEISTGSGSYGVNAGLNLSKTVDPLVIFSSIGYGYSFPIDGLTFKNDDMLGDKEVWMSEVEPGSSVSWSIGLGYSLSYMVSVNLNFQYGYVFKTKYKWHNGADNDSGDSSSASIGIGTGWRITPKRSINVSINNGLSSNAADYTLSVRVRFQFEL